MKDWFYNELNHVGVDYSQKENVNIYDEQMESFRDYEKEVEVFIEKLNPYDTYDKKVVDIGCGTGAFSISASKYFDKIYAVDVSEEMLTTAKNKAITQKIENISFYNSGFLNFQPKEEVDIVFSKWAFHHLPDYWKQIALLNINKMLKKDGIFFLSDVVFAFSPSIENDTNMMLNNLLNEFSKEFVEETKVHIKDEYRTYDWIIEGLIERAGFKIEKSNTKDTLESEYFCRKIKSFNT